jgi:hypothetical protein
VNSELQKVGVWLNLTPQQFDILQCINSIRGKGVEATPKEIQHEYKVLNNKYLMKPNLFNILRLLKGRGYIAQTNFGVYHVNFDRIEEALRLKKEDYINIIDDFDNIIDKVDGYFLQAHGRDSMPIVKYLDYDAFFQELTRHVRVAKVYYKVGKFAQTAYTARLTMDRRRGEYIRAIHDNCAKRNLKVVYLMNLDLDYLYRNALRNFKDQKLAYKECEDTIGRLEELSNTKNFNVFYTNHLLGIDLIIPERTQPSDVFLYVRDIRGGVIGGIQIKSPDVGKKARDVFLEECNSGINLKEPKGRKIISQLKQKLRKDYRQGRMDPLSRTTYT